MDREMLIDVAKYVGISLAVVATAGIAYHFLIARKSDKKMERRLEALSDKASKIIAYEETKLNEDYYL